MAGRLRQATPKPNVALRHRLQRRRHARPRRRMLTISRKEHESSRDKCPEGTRARAGLTAVTIVHFVFLSFHLVELTAACRKVAQSELVGRPASSVHTRVFAGCWRKRRYSPSHPGDRGDPTKVGVHQTRCSRATRGVAVTRRTVLDHCRLLRHALGFPARLCPGGASTLVRALPGAGKYCVPRMDPVPGRDSSARGASISL